MINNSSSFNWRHTIYAAIVTLGISLFCGTLFSLLAYKPLSESNNPIAQQFAEAIRNLFSHVGFYPDNTKISEKPDNGIKPSQPPHTSDSTTSQTSTSQVQTSLPKDDSPPRISETPSEPIKPSNPPLTGNSTDSQTSQNGIQTAPPEDDTTLAKTPQELGQDKYLAKVNSARDQLSDLPADMQIKFTLGVHTPIRTENVESAKEKSPIKNWEAIGLVSLSGEPLPLTVGDIQQMFDTKANTLYTASQAPTGEMPIINLLGYNTQTNQVSLLPNVRFPDFFRDALNATLNRELKSNNYEINRLDMNKVQPIRE